MLMEALLQERDSVKGGADSHIPCLRQAYPWQIHLSDHGNAAGRIHTIRSRRQDPILFTQGLPEGLRLFRLDKTSRFLKVSTKEGRRKRREEVEEADLGTGI